ncbi:MAG: O-antigen ligase family protein [Caldilineae bacterium]|nr:O-antigen ligase family protein [Caldilineae bacterium]
MLLARLRIDDPRARVRIVLAGAVLATLLGAALAVFVHPLAALACLLALAAAPFVMRDIDLAFLALVAVITLLPFAALPFGIGFNPTLLDLALGTVYLIFLMRLVLRDQARVHLPPLSGGVLLFMGLMVAALLAGSANGMPGRNQIRGFAELLLGAGLFFVVANLIEDRQRLRRIFLALVGFGFAAACIGLALYLLPDGLQVRLLSTLSVLDYPSGPGVLRFLNDDPGRLQRATGTSIDPNSFGGMLGVMTALLLPQAISRRPLIDRRLVLPAVALMSLALLATVSRGSLVGFVAALGVIGLVRDRRMLALGLVAGLGLLALAQVLPWTHAYVEHFLAGLAGRDRATVMRFGEYKDALRLIERYPWFGVGFGSPRDIDLYRGVSSLYLIIAETMGLIGLTAFLGLMATATLRLLLAWHGMPAGGQRALVLGCLAALATALTTGLVDHYFFTYPHAFALMWLILGLGMRAVEIEPEAAP